jgi:hypothetical protein
MHETARGQVPAAATSHGMVVQQQQQCVQQQTLGMESIPAQETIRFFRLFFLHQFCSDFARRYVILFLFFPSIYLSCQLSVFRPLSVSFF